MASSILAASFTRGSSAPIESDYHFASYEAMKEYYNNPIQAQTVYDGMVRAVSAGEGKTEFYEVLKDESGTIIFRNIFQPVIDAHLKDKDSIDESIRDCNDRIDVLITEINTPLSESIIPALVTTREDISNIRSSIETLDAQQQATITDVEVLTGRVDVNEEDIVNIKEKQIDTDRQVETLEKSTEENILELKVSIDENTNALKDSIESIQKNLNTIIANDSTDVDSITDIQKVLAGYDLNSTVKRDIDSLAHKVDKLYTILSTKIDVLSNALVTSNLRELLKQFGDRINALESLHREDDTQKESIKDDISILNLKVDNATSYTYSGDLITLKTDIRNISDEQLIDGIDYVVTGEKEAVDVGTYIVTITGKGAYAGFTQIFQWSVIAKGIEPKIEIEPGKFTYSGTNIEPNLTVIDESVGKILSSETDYIIKYSDNVNATATATATVILKGNYSGESSIQFEISKADVSLLKIEPVDDQSYTGEEIEPKLNITFGGNVLDDTDALIMKYESNTEPGIASVNLSTTDDSNFEGECAINFNIIADVTALSVEVIEDQVYTGEEIRPEIKVSLNNKEIDVNSNFSIKYKDNIKIGVASIILTALETSHFTGERTETFNIIKASEPTSTTPNDDIEAPTSDEDTGDDKSGSDEIYED